MPYPEEDDHEEFTHPSYAMISVHHWQGLKENLFGSSIQRHPSTICIEIKEGVRHHDLSRDWFYGGKVICRVEMTHVQFAELITTPNTGSGVPCTLRVTRDGPYKEVEDPPPQVVESEKVKVNFAKLSSSFIKKVKKAKADVADLLLGKKAPAKAARQEAVDILGRIIMELESNHPFRVDQFSEATEKVVNAAKAEVDGFVTQMVHRTGLDRLREIQAALPNTEERLLSSGNPVKGDHDEEDYRDLGAGKEREG